MRYYLILFFSFILLSCQEEINLDLPDSERRLVVEGSIENGFPPYIILSKSAGYFDEIDSNTVINSYVHNAEKVTVWYYSETGDSIGKILERLPEELGLPGLYTDIEYITSALSGNTAPYDFSKEGRTYFLEIKWNNQTITSETTIPTPTPLDSLWIDESSVDDEEFKCDIKAIYSDPADQQNNILIKSKRLQHYVKEKCNIENQPDFSLKLIDAGSDILINGETFETYFPKPSEGGGFPSGSYNSARNKECNDGTILEIPEDIVLIKFCQIDEPSMKFWRGLSRASASGGNPFSEPLNLVSNINGGLGIWSGYGAVYYKVPIILGTSILEQYDPQITVDENGNLIIDIL